MRTQWEEMWRFETARFAVIWDVAPEDDIDLSWDETGEVREDLESGRYTCFQCRMRVLLDGEEVAADYLGGCIYENPSEFRDHIGICAKGRNYGSYFSDMVRSAVKEARRRIRARPYMRA